MSFVRAYLVCFDHMSVSCSVIYVADHAVSTREAGFLPLVHVSSLSVVESIKDTTTLTAFVHLALGGVP